MADREIRTMAALSREPGESAEAWVLRLRSVVRGLSREGLERLVLLLATVTDVGRSEENRRAGGLQLSASAGAVDGAGAWIQVDSHPKTWGVSQQATADRAATNLARRIGAQYSGAGIAVQPTGAGLRVEGTDEVLRQTITRFAARWKTHALADALVGDEAEVAEERAPQ